MNKKTRIRGFEKISFAQFKKDFEGKLTDYEATYQKFPLPIRKTNDSAGYDLHTLFSFTLQPGESILVPTGLKAYMQPNEFMAIVIRSSIGIKQGIMLKNQMGIIDKDFYNNPSNEGHFQIGLINMGDSAWECQAGTAIAQAIFMPFLTVDSDKKSGFMRLGGIGSTDKEKKEC